MCIYCENVGMMIFSAEREVEKKKCIFNKDIADEISSVAVDENQSDMTLAEIMSTGEVLSMFFTLHLVIYFAILFLMKRLQLITFFWMSKTLS